MGDTLLVDEIAACLVTNLDIPTLLPFRLVCKCWHKIVDSLLSWLVASYSDVPVSCLNFRSVYVTIYPTVRSANIMTPEALSKLMLKRDVYSVDIARDLRNISAHETRDIELIRDIFTVTVRSDDKDLVRDTIATFYQHIGYKDVDEIIGVVIETIVKNKYDMTDLLMCWLGRRLTSVDDLSCTRLYCLAAVHNNTRALNSIYTNCMNYKSVHPGNIPIIVDAATISGSTEFLTAFSALTRL